MPGYSLLSIGSRAARNGVAAITPVNETLPGCQVVNTNWMRTPNLGEPCFISYMGFVGSASVQGIATVESPAFNNITKASPVQISGNHWGVKNWLAPGSTPSIPIGNQTDLRASTDNGNTAGAQEHLFVGLSWGSPARPWSEGMPDVSHLLFVDGSGEDAIADAAAWDLNAVAFTGTSLKPNRKYVALGLITRSTYAYAWRFVPQGGNTFRPGCVGTMRLIGDNYDRSNIYLPANGRFTFDGATPPTVELIDGSGSTPVVQMVCAAEDNMP